ncbi:MAG: hypothetical protein EHM24_14595 [Acidobacteria bacterium]|nr:MAG: hypothetical protein EHM24_14595 [Acidobacteriota bacterium]
MYDSDDKIRTFYAAMLDRLAAEPGVARVAAASLVPLAGGNDTSVHLEGRPPASDREKRYAQVRSVFGAFFDTFSIPLSAGRPFDDRDVEAARRSIVINREMAEQFFPSVDPLGGRLVVDFGKPTTLEVIGVVGNVREWGPTGIEPPIMYVSAHLAFSAIMRVAVRSAGDPAAVGGAIRRAARALDRNLAVARIEPMSQTLATRLAQPRLRTALLAGFAGVALLLTLIGLYGACPTPWRGDGGRSAFAPRWERNLRKCDEWCCGRAPHWWRQDSALAAGRRLPRPACCLLSCSRCGRATPPSSAPSLFAWPSRALSRC